MIQQVGDYNKWTGFVTKIGAAYTVTAHDRFCYLQAIADSNFAVVLPPVNEVKGLFFTFYDFVDAYSKTYTITCDGTDKIILSSGLSATFVLNTQNEFCILFSNGTNWIVIGAKN